MSTKYKTDIAQNAEEFAWFIQILRAARVASYLEIGSRYGGSLWRVAGTLPEGSRIVAVDFTNSLGGRSDSLESLEACIADLRGAGFDAHLLLGDSTDPAIVKQALALSPFDACFIDANHSLPFVTADWKNYGPMARIVGFHDIHWMRAPEWLGTRIEVPILWRKIKRSHHRWEERTLEKKNNGIGVVWRW